MVIGKSDAVTKVSLVPLRFIPGSACPATTEKPTFLHILKIMAANFKAYHAANRPRTFSVYP